MYSYTCVIHLGRIFSSILEFEQYLAIVRRDLNL